MMSDVFLRLARLSDSIVAGPVLFFRRVAVVERFIVIVSAFANLPELEALPSFFGNERAPTVTVHVPFTDIGRFVTCLTVDLANRHCFGIQGLVVVEDAVGEPVLAGQQAGAIGAADRIARHGVGEIDTFFRQLIEVRSPNVFIPHIAGGLSHRFRVPPNFVFLKGR